MPDAAIEFDTVDFSYEGPPVLQNATFVIGQGDFVSIVGPNGGGKTTLLKLMLGLLKPQRGWVHLLGMSPKSACPRVGYTPQFMTVDFDFPLSVTDVVLMGRIRTHGTLSSLWYNRRDREIVKKSLQIMQLEECANASFRTLSGGQRQRVLIARAICGEPDILLLDEPTNNIDIASEKILSDILTDLNRTMTVVMVSHDIAFVSRCVQYVICVNRTVAVHKTSALTGTTIHQLYGQDDLRLVLHDHR